MTDRLDEIRQRVEAATPGPWEAAECPDARYLGMVNAPCTSGDDSPELVACLMREDAEFIAHARDDVLWLLERIEAVELEVACKDGSLAQATRQLDAVRKLHTKDTINNEQVCGHCTYITQALEMVHLVTWPCVTIRMLDGGGE